MDTVVEGRQCAAVRIARGAMTVPVHEPACSPSLSFKFIRTTGELVVGHSAPFTIAVDPDTVSPSAPHAALIGVVGAGDGEVGVEERRRRTRRSWPSRGGGAP